MANQFAVSADGPTFDEIDKIRDTIPNANTFSKNTA